MPKVTRAQDSLRWPEKSGAAAERQGERLLSFRRWRHADPSDFASQRRLVGNGASWVAKTREAWAEIDLGDVYTIALVRLSNDAAEEYSDRNPVDYRILVATKYDADSRPPRGKRWRRCPASRCTA